MSYKPRSLFGLVEEMNSTLFLPHIQRPFVWSEEQMCRFMDSLMRNYPIQTLLFWRTKDAIKARKFMSEIDWNADLHKLYDNTKSARDVEKVFVLDGQQRLQTLFALFIGSIKSEGGGQSREAYLNMVSGVAPVEGDLIYELTFSPTAMALPHYRLRDLLGRHAMKNAEEIADELNEALDMTLGDSEEARRQRARLVRKNCGQLVSLLREDRHFWVEQLDGVASEYKYRRILEIFVRVNSGGTKLDAADLMFAAMKEGWAEIEENIESVADMLSSGHLEFDKAFVLKCLVVAHDKKAELDPEKFTSAEGDSLLKEIQTNWDRAETAFQELRDFIEQEIQLYSEKVVRSYGSFIPLFDFLFHNPKPDERNRRLMRAYYYKSQLFNWYGAQTDNIINAVHNRVGKALGGTFPMAPVKEYFGLSRGAPVELKQQHLEDGRLRFIVLNLLYVERFGKSPFNVRFKGNEPHVDHIYPKSILLNWFSLPTQEVNHIGNYRLLGATDNIRKRAEEPADYFARLKADGIDIENHLLLSDVSADPSLLACTEAAYRKFRGRRLGKIYEIATGIVNAEL